MVLTFSRRWERATLFASRLKVERKLRLPAQLDKVLAQLAKENDVSVNCAATNLLAAAITTLPGETP